ncbi:MAG: hypothetical protein KY467_01205 [Gemmatimonadetes bacterium]|nr:hypothetical protein [Gemmatimonadota bacterium]
MSRRPSAPVDTAIRALCQRLRAIRENYGGEGLALRPWAALLGERGYPLDFTTVGDWERGRTAVPASYVLMVHRISNVSVEWIMTGEGPAPSWAGFAEARAQRLQAAERPSS